MDSKEELKANLSTQLSKVKASVEGIKTKIEHAEADAKVKLHDQLKSLRGKRVKAEKVLEDLSATSQNAWEQVKSGVDQGWTELTHKAKNTLAKVREAIAKPRNDEDIRQIAYQLWQDEGCPDGRHLEHWVKAESVWQARQAVTEPDPQPTPQAKRPRKKVATRAKTKSRAKKTSTEQPARSEKNPE